MDWIPESIPKKGLSLSNIDLQEKFKGYWIKGKPLSYKPFSHGFEWRSAYFVALGPKLKLVVVPSQTGSHQVRVWPKSHEGHVMILKTKGKYFHKI